jgi:threonine-phosphate decarboxylase
MRSLESHGGNVHKACEELGMCEADIIDFSASINPLGVPRSVAAEIKRSIGSIVHYPDPEVKQLRSQIAEQLGVDARSIVYGNGSTELIYLVVRTLKPEKVLVPAPTFSEYERAVAMLGGTNGRGPGAKGKGRGIRDAEGVRYFLLKKEDWFDIDPSRYIDSMKGCSMAFLCNPNNPTGRLMNKADVFEIARAAKESKCYLVVDEAFIDFMPDHSVVREVERNPYLIVLRSMTKFYALSGLRLGYGIIPSSVGEAIKRQKEPWTVNTLAQKAGAVAIHDRDYQEKTFSVVAQEKTYLERSFKRLNMEYVPSAANYYLIKLNHADRAIDDLRRKGILVRGCADFKGLHGSYIRVAVKSRRDNARLIKELSRWLKG